MLALRLFWREWRGGQLSVLVLALALAVAIVTGMVSFTQRIQVALVGEAARFLAADRVLSSSRPLPETWLAEAQQRGLATAQFAVFPTMVFADEQSSLAVVKAVSEHYPLRGELGLADAPYQPARNVRAAPEPGTVWLDPRLFPALDVQVGDSLSVGERDLRITAVLVTEPDNGGQLSMMAPRLMMAEADLASTGIVQPGSRVEYSLLLAGEAEALDALAEWLKPQLQDWQRWIDLKDGRPAVAEALDRAAAFLLLSASLALLLAATAVWLAARHYVQGQQRAVAVLKTLGADRARLLQRYLGVSLGVGLLAILLGSGLGLLLELALRTLVVPLLGIAWPAASAVGYGAGAATGLFCLALFVWPLLWRLQGVAPGNLLRQEQDKPLHDAGVLPGLMLLCAVVGLVSGWWQLSLFFLLAVLGLVLVLALVLRGLLLLLKRFRPAPGSVLYLALSAWQRRPWSSVTQMLVFSLAFLLVGTVSLARSGLLDTWQQQLPEDAPNYFVLNIAPHEQAAVASFLDEAGLETAGLYPMVRGRLVSINGHDPVLAPAEGRAERDPSLNRELNLSWSETLPLDNAIVAGAWAWQADADEPTVSVEVELAGRLGLKLGDRVGFDLAGQTLEARVSSLRSLNWESMRPNFYFLFSPGALDEHPATWMTSFHLPAGQEAIALRLSRQFPTVSAISLDGVFSQVRAVVQQISLVMQLVFGLMLVAGVLVLLAALQTVLAERRWESALLKALGAEPNRLHRSLWLEFALMGLLAGLLGAAGAELALWLVASQALQLQAGWHPLLWLSLPLLGLLLVSCAGYGRLRGTLATPPARILQTGH